MAVSGEWKHLGRLMEKPQGMLVTNKHSCALYTQTLRFKTARNQGDEHSSKELFLSRQVCT